MDSTIIKNQFSKIISLGLDSSVNKNQQKKIRILNAFCFIWLFLTILVFIGDYFIKNKEPITTIILCGTMIIACSCVMYLTFKKKYFLAKLMFVLSEIIITIIISKHIYPKAFLEYYFIFPPSIALILIDSKFYNYVILFITYLVMIVPNGHEEIYDQEIFNYFHLTFLFFSIFILLNYFKTLNSKNESTLESKKEELEKINKYQSQFFINISHEIRTPLTLIKGQIEELKKLHTSQPQLIKIEEGLSHQVNEIKSMVDDVLDSAKIKSSDFKLNLKQISITELINNIYMSFETNFELKKIDFKLISLDKDYEMKADLDYLKRAINNLVVNALKYTDKEGEVSIKLTKHKQELGISIHDNGIGIPKEDIARICNQFYQVDNDINRSGGSGIGLSFSKEIVELHGGKLQIISELNKGSEFKILFPLDHCAVLERGDYHHIKEKRLNSEEHINQTPKNNECFLIVDDNSEMRQYVKLILKDYKCIEAENGLEALELLEVNKVDFVITDYMMPKMDGPNFITTLKEKKYEMPVLMLTARTDKESRLNSFRLGIDDYLNKPFDRDELLIRVENTLTNHLNRIKYIDKEEITTEEIEQTQEWIEQVEQYIFQECSKPNFKQIDVAEYFNLSESSLYRKIKTSRGKTPNQFITELKLQKARKIIENDPEVPLKKLSLEVGFKHNHYFSEIYFDRFGNKPWSKN
ncbi:hybrid sensor histidine kinase/response regulator transcription factor [Aquimarina megaterium]|uniref:hybrid sensor histidine kinase/response regulator transcription factor n=1 Tax=Aquimarina megaterium TaxID=1443666 RepID=UPI000943B4A5|nr:response regulator [Aquimarina megaterium]